MTHWGDESGFPRHELLISVVILLILVAILIPAVLERLPTGREPEVIERVEWSAATPLAEKHRLGFSGHSTTLFATDEGFRARTWAGVGLVGDLFLLLAGVAFFGGASEAKDVWAGKNTPTGERLGCIGVLLVAMVLCGAAGFVGVRHMLRVTEATVTPSGASIETRYFGRPRGEPIEITVEKYEIVKGRSWRQHRVVAVDGAGARHTLFAYKSSREEDFAIVVGALESVQE